MNLFDLIFALVVLSLILLILAAAFCLVTRKRKAAKMLSSGSAVLVIGYLAIVAAAGIASPQRVIAMGEEQRWDDWCVTVDSVHRQKLAGVNVYDVALTLHNRAHRAAQSAPRGSTAYVLDQKGRRFDAEPFAADAALDARLAPDEIRTVHRIFRLPDNAQAPGLVVTHGGTFPALFIIRDSMSLGHKPNIIRLDGPGI
ncbi:MAG: hypothetical protein U0570_10845 [Phycisphaerales bacterium]